MYRQIPVGLVSYLNCLPYEWAFERILKQHPNTLNIIRFTPSKLIEFYQRCKNGIFLPPIAAINTNYNIPKTLPYGISCDGAVGSVCLFANTPLKKINTVYLDIESRTSNILIQILGAHFLKRKMQYKKHYTPPLESEEAILLIGDKALKSKSKYTHIYDLGTLWKDFTGLPFVFAQWIIKEGDTDQKMLRVISQEIHLTLEKLPTLIHSANLAEATKAYLTQSIQYHIDRKKEKSIQLFQQLIQKTRLHI